jgi:cardiolipin synthase
MSVRPTSRAAGSRPGARLIDPAAIRTLRQVSERALSRASGAPVVLGNAVRILEDAAGNYPVWLEAIRRAERTIYLESYIFDEDRVGLAFAEALIERAQAGVRVRIVRDWLGTRAGASRAFWRRLMQAGIDVRCFNRFQLGSPFAWVTRDHRKMITVDSQIAFVAGLCISQRWNGDPARRIPPWRDTGLEIRGPAVADVEHAFAEMWHNLGEPLPPEELASGEERAPAGEVALRVLAGTPSTAGLFRMDQLVAVLARRSLWLTDAYFVGITPYVQALRAASRDGVDVRLLVPSSSDIPIVRTLSRAGYKSLLEDGVRIFEWNGSMLHAKTAVVDARFCRVGSSNLNLASFVGNYELDVAVEDEQIAGQMEQMYLRDLSNSTEITLHNNRVVRRAEPSASLLQQAAAAPEPPASEPAGPQFEPIPESELSPAQRRRGSRRRRRRGSRGATVGALRVANTVGAAVANRRTLERADGTVLSVAGAVLAALAVIAVFWPRSVALPFAFLALWIGLALLWRGLRLAAPPKRPPQ